MDLLDLIPRSLSLDRPSTRRRATEWATCGAIFLIFLSAVLGVFDSRRYHPPRDLATIDQLSADPPETLKFAIVEEAGLTHVVWIGQLRHASFPSGPPVCVFDEAGKLEGRTSDVDDSDNQFVRTLYSRAQAAPAISPQEAVNFCRRNRASGDGSSQGRP